MFTLIVLVTLWVKAMGSYLNNILKVHIKLSQPLPDFRLICETSSKGIISQLAGQKLLYNLSSTVKKMHIS